MISDKNLLMTNFTYFEIVEQVTCGGTVNSK